jgi:transcriptional regulator NrdR family protein
MSDEECMHTITYVVNSRWVVTLDGWLGVKRRRKCRACGAELFTVEIPIAEYFKGKEEVMLTTFRLKPGDKDE